MPGREVEHWQQPLFEKSSVSLYGTPIKIEDGLAWVGVKAEAELGFFERAEFTTVIKQEFSSFNELENEITDSRYGELLLSIKQSDEGGRFWRNEGCYALFLLVTDQAEHLDAEVTWVTLGELESYTLQKGMVTNELRTAISLLLSKA